MNASPQSSNKGAHWVIWFSLLALGILAASHARGGDLRLVFKPTWQDQSIQINHWIPEAPPAGRSIGEFRFLLSRPALQHEDGSWHTMRDVFALVDFTNEDSASVSIPVPDEGEFRAIRFDIGVPPSENSATIPSLGEQHPLNPVSCPLKIDGKPGYTFLRLAGLWRQEDGQLGKFEYELAGDAHLTRVELPIEVDSTRSNKIQIKVDAAVALQDFDVRRMDEVKSHAALTTFSFNLRKAILITTATQTDARGGVIRLTQN